MLGIFLQSVGTEDAVKQFEYWDESNPIWGEKCSVKVPMAKKAKQKMFEEHVIQIKGKVDEASDAVDMLNTYLEMCPGPLQNDPRYSETLTDPDGTKELSPKEWDSLFPSSEYKDPDDGKNALSLIKGQVSQWLTRFDRLKTVQSDCEISMDLETGGLASRTKAKAKAKLSKKKNKAQEIAKIAKEAVQAKVTKVKLSVKAKWDKVRKSRKKTPTIPDLNDKAVLQDTVDALKNDLCTASKLGDLKDSVISKCPGPDMCADQKNPRQQSNKQRVKKFAVAGINHILSKASETMAELAAKAGTTWAAQPRKVKSFATLGMANNGKKLAGTTVKVKIGLAKIKTGSVILAATGDTTTIIDGVLDLIESALIVFGVETNAVEKFIANSVCDPIAAYVLCNDAGINIRDKTKQGADICGTLAPPTTLEEFQAQTKAAEEQRAEDAKAEASSAAKDKKDRDAMTCDDMDKLFGQELHGVAATGEDLKTAAGRQLAGVNKAPTKKGHAAAAAAKKAAPAKKAVKKAPPKAKPAA